MPGVHTSQEGFRNPAILTDAPLVAYVDSRGNKAPTSGVLYCRRGMLTVFIIAEDWMLRAGVRAELREKGIEALGMETLDDAAKAIAAGHIPSAIVLEGSAGKTNPEALEQLARRVPVIVVASRWEPALSESVAAMLYRPVRVGDVVARVLQALQGHAA
jgi:nucleotide-binding universal stress UspA family protein